MANNSYICNQCGEIFKTKANLKSHQTRSKYCKILTKAIIICKTCHKKFDNLKELDQHICVEDGSNNLSYTNDMINKLQIINEHYNLDYDCNDLITFVEDRKGHDFRYAIDSSKISNELNFSVNTNFDKALIKTIEWYTNRI